MKVTALKIVIYLMAILSYSCNSNAPKTIPMASINTIEPFSGLTLKEAKARAVEERKELMVLVHSEDDISELVKSLGFDAKSSVEWNNIKILIALKSNAADGMKMIKEFNILAFPVVLHFNKNGKLKYPANYGRIDPWIKADDEGRKNILKTLEKEVVQIEMNPDLLNTLIYNFPLEGKQDIGLLHFKWKNALFDNLSKEFFASQEGCMHLKQFADDIFLNIFDRLYAEKEFYDLSWKAYGTSFQELAIWAFRKNYDKLIRQENQELFYELDFKRSEYLENVSDPKMAKLRLTYLKKYGPTYLIVPAIHSYFASASNWKNDLNQELNFQYAKLLSALGRTKVDFILALQIVQNASTKKTQSRYYLLEKDLLSKLDKPNLVNALEFKLEKIKTEFAQFISETELYISSEKNTPFDSNHLKQAWVPKSFNENKRSFFPKTVQQINGSYHFEIEVRTSTTKMIKEKFSTYTWKIEFSTYGDVINNVFNLVD